MTQSICIQGLSVEMCVLNNTTIIQIFYNTLSARTSFFYIHSFFCSCCLFLSVSHFDNHTKKIVNIHIYILYKIPKGTCREHSTIFTIVLCCSNKIYLIIFFFVSCFWFFLFLGIYLGCREDMYNTQICLTTYLFSHFIV